MMDTVVAVKKLSTGLFGMLMVLGLVGCAIGPTQVEVAPSPLAAKSVAREGTILVKEFTDNREAGHKQTIGNKRNGYGMVLGSFVTKDGVKLEALLTQHFVEALQSAGYSVVMQKSGASDQAQPFDTVMTGEITDFWVDQFMMVWHSVDVNLTLKDQSEVHVLWARKIHGEQTNVLWMGLPSEIEKVIRQSLDVAMSQTLKELSAEDFQVAAKPVGKS